MRVRFLFTAIIVAASVIATGCDSTVNNDDPATVSLNLQAEFNGQPLNTSSTYLHNGRAVSISTARVYLSQFTLVSDTGQEFGFTADPITVPARADDGTDVVHTVTDLIMLAKHDAGAANWSLGDVPAGKITSIRFQAGIGGLDNKVDPTQVPAGHALAKHADRNNHWSWNSGYIYLRLDGEVDTDGDGTPDSPWETHIGAPNYLREVTLPVSVDMEGGENVRLNLTVDYATFLADVDMGLESERMCHTMDNMPVAQKVRSRIGSAFSFNGVQAGQ